MAKPASLPTDLILSIICRADAATIICCTATCKLLRRHITSTAFLHRLGPDHITVGLIYRYRDDVPPGSPPFISTRPSLQVPSFHPSFADLLHSYAPVASHNGLLVLRRYRPMYLEHAELCVCNPITGRRHFVPPPTVYDQTLALLTGGDGTSRSFRLVAVDLTWLTMGCFKTQTFSSTTGAWGPITTNLTPMYHMKVDVIRHHTIVLNSVLHWLCQSRSSYIVLTFHVDTAEVASIEIPDACVHQCVLDTAEDLLLGSLADGRLSLVVVEDVVMSIWILSQDDKRWIRHKEIEWERILRSARSEVPLYRCHKIQLEWLEEKSGGVFLQMAGVGLLFLNLTTNEVSKIKGSKDIMAFRFCPYESDLVALLSAMKTF